MSQRDKKFQGYIMQKKIYHAKNNYGTGLANVFERHCSVLGINIKDRLPAGRGSDDMVIPNLLEHRLRFRRTHNR